MKQKASQTPPEQLSRQVNMRYVPTIVKLREIDHKTYARIFSHREETVYTWDEEDDGNEMKLLAESYILEGQQVPVELLDDELYPGQPHGTKPLLRGSRRIEMLHQCIARKIEPDRIHSDMDVQAVLVSGGDRKDYIVRSICDNELRVALSDPKKLEAAEQMLKEGISATRAARALGMSATQFTRYTRRIHSIAMQAHIAKDHITPTDADALLEAAGQFNRISEMEADFAVVVAAINKEIAEAKVKASANKDKFDEKKHGVVKNYIKSTHVKAWIEAIRASKPFSYAKASKSTGDQTTFACTLDPKVGKLKIPPLNIDLHKVDFATLGEVAGKLKGTADRVEKFYLMRKAQRALGHDRVTGEDKTGLLDYFRSHGDKENAAKIEAEIARHQGVADPSHGQVAPRVEEPLSDAIAIPAEPVGYEDESEEFDSAIDGGPADPGSDAPPPEANKGKDAR